MVAVDLSLLAGLLAVEGFNTVWLSTFDGEAGAAINETDWKIITNVNFNNEVQEYVSSTDNLQLSGDQSLLIIPLKSDDGHWTSARIESQGTYTPAEGKVTRFQAQLRYGDTEQDKLQGIWPAFWMLGESYRQGTPWPECGELDIMERKNGEDVGHGTPHCGPSGVNPCGAMTKKVSLPDNDWRTWAMEIDRTDGEWRKQEIRWFLDDDNYNTVTGEDVDDEGTWKALAHSPLFFLLNVAVGGNWPGAPNDDTADGKDSMLEVRYVAVYDK